MRTATATRTGTKTPSPALPIARGFLGISALPKALHRPGQTPEGTARLDPIPEAIFPRVDRSLASGLSPSPADAGARPGRDIRAPWPLARRQRGLFLSPSEQRKALPSIRRPREGARGHDQRLTMRPAHPVLAARYGATSGAGRTGTGFRRWGVSRATCGGPVDALVVPMRGPRDMRMPAKAGLITCAFGEVAKLSEVLQNLLQNPRTQNFAARRASLAPI